jgi:hypothetical protein
MNNNFDKLSIAILVLASILSGCAHVQFDKLNDNGNNDGGNYGDGIVVYQPRPFLLVAENAEGTLTSSIIYLPDYEKGYVIRPKAGIGKVDLNLKLDQGWNLVEYGNTADSRLPETVASLAGAIPGISPAEDQPSERGPMGPGLYRIVYDDGGMKVSGLKKVELR